MKTDRPIFCSFSVGLDDLPRREQGNDERVLAVLRQRRRFSVFEAAANPVIAATMTRLCRDRLRTVDLGYPWTGVTHIDGVALNDDPTP